MVANIKQNLDYFFAISLAIAIPNFKFLLPILIAMWTLSLFFRIKDLKFRKQQKFSLILLGFFHLNLLGMAYTEPANMSRGWFDIEIKLSFLLFPLIFLLIPQLSPQRIQKVISVFVISVLVACFWHLLRSVFSYYGGENIYTFYGNNFTKPFHIGYFAIYLNTAFIGLITIKEGILKKYNWLYIFSFLLLSISIILTTSKVGIVTFILLILGYFIFQIKSNGFKHYHLVLLAALIFVFVAFSNSKAASRFKLAYNQLTKVELSPESEGSTQARVFALKTSYQIVKDHWAIGVGTGDIDIETINRYKAYGYTGALKRKLNAHNQFMQTFGAIGLLGILVLIIMFGFIIFEGVQNKNLILFGFSFVTLLFAITESMFETQAGIVFFTFFSLILSQNNSDYDSILSS